MIKYRSSVWQPETKWWILKISGIETLVKSLENITSFAWIWTYISVDIYIISWKYSAKINFLCIVVSREWFWNLTLLHIFITMCCGRKLTMLYAHVCAQAVPLHYFVNNSPLHLCPKLHTVLRIPKMYYWSSVNFPFHSKSSCPAITRTCLLVYILLTYLSCGQTNHV